MKYFYHILLTAIILVTGFSQSFAQSDRAFIRQGNRSYKSQKWAAAETQYRKAISKNGKNPQAIYNLGCALMMQQKDSMAMGQFENAAKLESSKFRRSKSYHNMGVILQNHREYAKAISCYEMSLRCNPQDNETRYNLALCKKLLKNDKQNQNNKDKNNKNKNKNNKDNKDQNKDQNKNKNKDKQDKNKDQNKDKDQQNKNQQNKNQQNQDKMSRDNAEQLLNAAVQQEKATKQKLQKAMSQPRRKAYEKNW